MQSVFLPSSSAGVLLSARGQCTRIGRRRGQQTESISSFMRGNAKRFLMYQKSSLRRKSRAGRVAKKETGSWKYNVTDNSRNTAFKEVWRAASADNFRSVNQVRERRHGQSRGKFVLRWGCPLCILDFSLVSIVLILSWGNCC